MVTKGERERLIRNLRLKYIYTTIYRVDTQRGPTV